MALPGLIDRFGRKHDSLRISVTDRCNIRCFYCMPDGPLQFLDSDRLLRFDQITRVVRVLAKAGIRKLRLTGGEPLMRPHVDQLIAQLVQVPGITDLALTTNGMLLADQAEQLHNAGLQRLNISLDTLREESFQRISRRPGLDRVLRGIDTALQVGFAQVRLNALAIRNLTEDELVPLVSFAIERGLQMRFIEYMPLDAERQWQSDRVLSGQEILARLSQHFGPLEPVERPDPSQPAEDYALPGGRGTVGIIRPVSQPFCGACNRLRLTAEGSLRNCLFSHEDWNLRELLELPDSEQQLLARIEACVAAKLPGHLISQSGFRPPDRAMYQIGG